MSQLATWSADSTYETKPWSLIPVQRRRQAAGLNIPRTGIEAQEIVAEEDGLGVADIRAAHHHFEVHTGAVLADLRVALSISTFRSG